HSKPLRSPPQAQSSREARQLERTNGPLVDARSAIRSSRPRSLADMSATLSDVCFTPISRHAQRRHRRPLNAISGHQVAESIFHPTVAELCPCLATLSAEVMVSGCVSDESAHVGQCGSP